MDFCEDCHLESAYEDAQNGGGYDPLDVTGWNDYDFWEEDERRDDEDYGW